MYQPNFHYKKFWNFIKFVNWQENSYLGVEEITKRVMKKYNHATILKFSKIYKLFEQRISFLSGENPQSIDIYGEIISRGSFYYQSVNKDIVLTYSQRNPVRESFCYIFLPVEFAKFPNGKNF